MDKRPRFNPKRSASVAFNPFTQNVSNPAADPDTRVKRLAIKNSKARPASSSDDISGQALPVLTRALRAILADPMESTPESLQYLYSLCESLVNRGKEHCQTLYDRIRIELERKAGRARSRLADGLASLNISSIHDDSGPELEWLQSLESAWKPFLDQLLMTRSVFLYLDRTFVLSSSGLLSIWDLGIDTFRHIVVEDPEISAQITKGILHTVQRMRSMAEISRTLLQSLVSLLTALSPQTYDAVFATPFLSASRLHFAEEASKRVLEQDPWVYLAYTAKTIEEEGQRADELLGGTTKAPLLRVLEEELIATPMDTLLKDGLPRLMDDDRVADLARLYSLSARAGVLASLRTAFTEHVKSAGLAVVSDPAKDATMIPSLLEYQRRIDNIIARAFADDGDFVHSFRGAFEWFINKRENKPAEMLAKYLDAHMRSGNRTASDAEVEVTLRQVIGLFRLTQGKDIFEAFYKRDLAKRLLLNKSASFDAERMMLMKLKDECGPGFTAKLETMFKDVELSNEITQSYRESRGSLDAFDLSVSILTAGNWPTFVPVNVTMPPEMARIQDRFKTFYTSRYSGRSLQWLHSLDHCTIRAEFPKGGRKELSVSLFQALVLLLFATLPAGEQINYKDVAAQTGLIGGELDRTLQSLACGKVRVLSKFPKGKDVSPTDSFALNVDFKDDRYKIRINQIQQKETVEEQKSTTDRVFMDRQSHLQLAIVRILKSRKTLKHSELVHETVAQIKDRFKVEVSEIKKAIDSLMERDYLERAEGTRDTYNYLA